ncbi:hypothetical protein BCEP27_50385 [Burkholderia cepacia]
MADCTGRCNTLDAAQAVEVLQTKQRRRIYYTEPQKALTRRGRGGAFDDHRRPKSYASSAVTYG